MGGSARLQVVAVLACVLGLDSADASAIGASETQLEHGLHLTTSDIGLVLAASGAVAAVFTLPAGALVDRWNRTRLLAAAASVWGVAVLGSALAPNLVGLLGAQLVLGGATAVAGPAVASLIGDYFPLRERGHVYGWVLTGELLGAGVGLVVAGGLAAVTWRLSFAALSVPSVGVVWLLHRLPEPARGGASRLEVGSDEFVDDVEPYPDEVPAAVRDADDRVPFWTAVRYVLSIRTNVVLIVVSSLGYFFFAGVRGFAVAFVKQQYDVGQAVATSLVPVIGLGAVAGVIVAGRLSDRRFRDGVPTGRILAAGVAMLLAVVCTTPAFLTTSLYVAVPFLIAGSACVGGENPPMDAARLDVVRPQVWGRAEGVRTLLKSGAQALSPLCFGLLADHVFGGGRTGLRDAFLVMLVPLVAGGVLLLTVGRRFYPDDVRAARHKRRPAAQPVAPSEVPSAP